MSVPLTLGPLGLQRLAAALIRMSALTNRHNVRLDPYGYVEMSVDGIVFRATWDEASDSYRLDDRVGD